ncbi:MAG: DUF4357 domain-containing protein [Methanobrevibacter sp.]|jgi:hypothetical protein|nr:DUF4357 domain-containing protein [Methanobrevibacter sp.]
MTKKGYVYILTNPSFREDWVKIGKSSREVDVRSKELDNTAIPLPFEIYATLKTEKYDKVEKNLHEIFTDLADARIRKSREFFNIKPEKAVKYLISQSELLNDAELNLPDESNNKNLKQKSSYKGKYTVNTDEIFYFYRSSTDARMKVENSTYILLAGSKIDSNTNTQTATNLRKQYKNSLENNITTENIKFSSPSGAGLFVAGGNVNGKYYWRTKEDKKLDEFIVYD